MISGLYIVLDIGKTNAKLTLWDSNGALVRRETRTNNRITSGAYPALDTAGIEAWLTETLQKFSEIGPIEAIFPVAHGAALAVVNNEKLALPVLDYEKSYSLSDQESYNAIRAPFAVTGSPSLPDGLNLGRQIFWLQENYPDEFSGATFLLWPQYWSWLLTGTPTSELTSLGCHTDLWQPNNKDFSALAKKQGWDMMFPPLRNADDVIGTLSEQWATKTGLSPSVKVYCGIHDSNAALVAAHAFENIDPSDSTALSTGTWFIAMRNIFGNSGSISDLPEGRDCLMNVNYKGHSIPTSRLMGGREIAVLIEHQAHRIDMLADQPALLSAVDTVLASQNMILPTFAKGFGPVPNSQGQWINKPDEWIYRRAAICLYAALMTNLSLDLIGAQNTLLIEGRFAKSEVFVKTIASLRPTMKIYTSNVHNDVSFGALKLMCPYIPPSTALKKITPLSCDLTSYANSWNKRVQQILETTT